jgi:hypothetical protein
MIPDNWSASGSNKAAVSEVVLKEGTPMTEEDVKAVNDALEGTDDTADKSAATSESVDATPEGEDTSKSADPDDATDEVVEDANKGADNDSDDSEESVDTKTTEPDLTKAVGAAVEEVVTNDFLSKMFEDNSDILVKAVKAELDKDASELRKMFVGIVESSSESLAKSHSELCERVETVERMATPGGPNLRRTEVERVNARKSDLVREVMRYKAMASAAEDPDLRKGYTQKALQIDAELKAL